MFELDELSPMKNSEGFSVSIEVLRKIVELKELEKTEKEQIAEKYCADSKAITMAEAFDMFIDRQLGIIERPAYRELESYMMSLTQENIADLTLLMYMGKDMNCNMNKAPGKERFMDFFDRYSYIVCDKSKEDLVYILLGKTPLLMYLRTGYRLLMAPLGTSIDTFSHNWDEM